MSLSQVLPLGHEAIQSPTSATTEVGSTNFETKPTSTLYPKIGKFSDFLHKLKRTSPSTRIAPLIGSVKLHGAHADWVVSSDDIVRVQSRNVLDLSSTNDPYGLVAFTTPIRTVILRLRDDILRRYIKLNPEIPLDRKYPVIIAGEWCGRGIQKGMAISQLARHFVIISIRVNDAWVAESEYTDLCNEAHGIYHIGNAPTYKLDLSLDDIDGSEAAIQAFVSDVEKVCPYGLMRGVTGKGEGIVWKALGHMQTPELWFKYRGDSTAVSHSWKLPAAAVAPDNRQREDSFATAVVTVQRLEQGWEFLKETDVFRNEAGVGKFLAWITNDIFVEEAREMKEKEISKGKLKPFVKKIAAPWYKQKLTEATREDMTYIEGIADGIANMTA
ncbi:MAG: hypothetical protein Q9218_001859 [Villophora microphyllina]